jgi:flagellar biogenesis protein FliO
MKEKILHMIVLLTVCLFCPYGYGETTLPENTIKIAPSTEKSENLDPYLQSHTPPKNYFDLKPDDKEGDRFLSEFMNMLTTLGIIVVIILMATWFLKRMVSGKIQQLNTTSLVKVIERRILSPKTSLYLLDIEGKGVILAESSNGVVSLGNFDVAQTDPSQQPMAFKEIMKNKEAL